MSGWQIGIDPERGYVAFAPPAAGDPTRSTRCLKVSPSTLRLGVDTEFLADAASVCILEPTRRPRDTDAWHALGLWEGLCIANGTSPDRIPYETLACVYGLRGAVGRHWNKVARDHVVKMIAGQLSEDLYRAALLAIHAGRSGGSGRRT